MKKIVIELSDTIYDNIKCHKVTWWDVNPICKAIDNGVILPNEDEDKKDMI